MEELPKLVTSELKVVDYHEPFNGTVSVSWRKAEKPIFEEIASIVSKSLSEYVGVTISRISSAALAGEIRERLAMTYPNLSDSELSGFKVSIDLGAMTIDVGSINSIVEKIARAKNVL